MATELLNHSRKFTRALKMLGRAAEDRKDALKENFDHLKDAAGDALEKSGKKIRLCRQTLKVWDREARKNPWKAVGIAAASALFVGYIAGLLKRKKT